MARRPVVVLSLGILMLTLAVSAAAFVANALVDVSEIFSLTLIIFGIWIVVLAGMRAADPEDYGEGVFNIWSNS